MIHYIVWGLVAFVVLVVVDLVRIATDEQPPPRKPPVPRRASPWR